METIMKFLKIFGFILLVVIGLALIIFLACLGVIVSPILLLGYFGKLYFDFRNERMRVKARLEYKLNKNVLN